MLHVREIAPTRSTLQEFVLFPKMLYKNDKNYVALPVHRQVRILLGRHNALISNGVQCFIMAYDGKKPVGRLLVGIDFRVIQRKGERQGYISLFECIDNQEAANVLLDAAKVFLKLNNITSIIGPNPAMFDDFGVGLLTKGSSIPPTFLSPYNPPYYATLFEKAGFIKYRDYYAFDLPLTALKDSRYESVLHRAGKRFGYTIENVNLRNDLKRRSREFARIIAESTPSEWDVMPPTAETLYRELKLVKQVLWPEFVLMAYAGERPIGLLLILPDMNIILNGIGSHFFPIGTFRMLFARSYIKRMRSVMLYVVPDFQNKGVEAIMMNRALEAARINGIRQAEASMINEQNLKMQLAVEKLGGVVSKVYRQYRLEI